MAQKRSKTLVANVEPHFYAIAASFAFKQNRSLSDYLRGLVLMDLEGAGLVGPADYERVQHGK